VGFAAAGREMLLLGQDSDPPKLPVGLSVTLTMLATLGDPHYIGLNGFELYDQNGAPIPLRPDQVRGL